MVIWCNQHRYAVIHKRFLKYIVKNIISKSTNCNRIFCRISLFKKVAMVTFAYTSLQTAYDKIRTFPLDRRVLTVFSVSVHFHY